MPRVLVAVTAFAAMFSAAAQPPNSASHILSQNTLGGAGSHAESASYVLDGTLSQTSTVGEAASSSYLLSSGFWTTASLTMNLTVQGSGSGDGNMTAVGISCGSMMGVTSGDCDESVSHGQSRSIVATPLTGNAFDSWSGCDSLDTTALSDDTCIVLLNEPKSVNAGFIALGSIGDRVWRDINGDGVQDMGEPGINGVTVNLNGVESRSTTTSGDGDYQFLDLLPGTYAVSIDTSSLPLGVVPSSDLDGVGTPHAAAVVVSDDQDRADINFGYQPLADLEITKADATDPLGEGQSQTYTLVVINHGPAPATGVVITDALPASTSLVATSGCAEDPSATPTCSIGDLAIGASASVSINVTVQSTAPAVLINTASVVAAETDPDTGNNSASATTAIDFAPPRVSSVDTENSTADGELTGCETVNGVIVGRLLVQFNEAIIDATQSNRWQLLRAGADHSLSTTQCGTLVGDDIGIAISNIAWNAAGRVASLTTATSLVPDQYRLLACGTGASALHDTAGNALDGDGNGSMGGDFLLQFRADPDNLMANGHFDCDLSSWIADSTSPMEIAPAMDDFQNSPNSGSAAVTRLVSDDFALGQCASVQSLFPYALSARVTIDTDSIGVGVDVLCSFYDDPACAGQLLQSPPTSITLIADTGGTWLPLAQEFNSPAGAQSILCSIGFRPIGDSSFDARLDRVDLRRTDSVVGSGAIFSDGFE